MAENLFLRFQWMEPRSASLQQAMYDIHTPDDFEKLLGLMGKFGESEVFDLEIFDHEHRALAPTVAKLFCTMLSIPPDRLRIK